jgi:hypothetical protein
MKGRAGGILKWLNRHRIKELKIREGYGKENKEETSF